MILDNGVSFFEKMSGMLLDKNGQEFLVDFDMKAESSSTYSLINTGKTVVSGVLNLKPDLEDVYFWGSLHMGPFTKREIVYDLYFNGEEGEKYNLRAKKSINFLKVIKSMTQMETKLYKDGEFFAQGTMTFDLKQLPSFLKSFKPYSSFKKLSSHKEEIDFHLNEEEKKTIKAVAEAILIRENLDAKLLEEIFEESSFFPPTIFKAYRYAIKAFNLSTTLSHGKKFNKLSYSQRIIHAESIDKSKSEFPKKLLQILGLAIKSSYFKQEQFLKKVGYQKEKYNPPKENEKYMRQVVDIDELDESIDVYCEVLVVGTGAGGAVVAKELAQKGHAVAMLEEGKFHKRNEFTGEPIARVKKFWKDNGLNFSLGNTSISVPLGKMVGGTTAINSGTCFRTPDPVFKEWNEKFMFPKEFSAQGFSAYFEKVEEHISVQAGEERYLGNLKAPILKGCREMGSEMYPLPRNAEGCDGDGTCIFACPKDAKKSTNVSYVPMALKAGAMLYTGLSLKQLLRKGNRVIGAVARGNDSYGRVKQLNIFAENIVLSCGSIYSPLLLKENNFRLKNIGRNLSLHPGHGLIGKFKNEMDQWFGIPQGIGIEKHGLKDTCFEGYYLPPSLLGALLPFNGSELMRLMSSFKYLGQYGFMVRDENNGRVFMGPAKMPFIHYNLSDASIEKLKLGSSFLAELMLRGGAEYVYTGVASKKIVKSIKEAKEISQMKLKASDFALLGAHPLGTCKMGKNPEEAVVDFENKVFGLENLYVMDGSVIPSSLGVNPQVTIMAFATRAAEIIASKIN